MSKRNTNTSTVSPTKNVLGVIKKLKQNEKQRYIASKKKWKTGISFSLKYLARTRILTPFQKRVPKRIDSLNKNSNRIFLRVRMD